MGANADNLQLCSGTSGAFRVAPVGTFNVAGGSHSNNVSFDNDGTVNVNGGSLGWNGSTPDTNDGHFAIAAGAELVPSADLPLGSTGKIDGAGTLRMAGGTTTIPDGATLDPATVDMTSGTVAINGTTPATTLDSVIMRSSSAVLSGSRDRSITALDVRGGQLAGNNTTTVTGSFAKTTTDSLTISQATAVPDIDMTWDQGTICVSNDGRLRLAHTFTVGTNAGNLQNCSGVTGQLIVLAGGKVEKTDGATNFFTLPVHNGGTIAIGDGRTISFSDLQNESRRHAHRPRHRRRHGHQRGRHRDPGSRDVHGRRAESELGHDHGPRRRHPRDHQRARAVGRHHHDPGRPAC